MRAVILAGGKGTRLNLIPCIPKPSCRSMFTDSSYCHIQLRNNGFDHYSRSGLYADMIKTYFMEAKNSMSK